MKNKKTNGEYHLDLNNLQGTEYEDGYDKGKSDAIKGFDKIKKHIKDVMWCNAHDVGLLEDLIIYIDKLKQDLNANLCEQERKDNENKE